MGKLVEKMDKLVECCESFINALYDALEDVVDKILNTFEEVNWRELFTEYIEAIKAESDSKSKKVQEQISRTIFDMQMKHYKYDNKIKLVRFNRRIAPKSWTGKNYKKGG